MPKIVEIIGPSGSGKSSIYESLRDKWEPLDSWVTYDDLNKKRVKSLDRVLHKARKKVGKLLSKRDGNDKKPEFSDDWKFIGYDNSIYFGDRYDDFKTSMMDVVGEYCRYGFDGSDKRFIATYMIMWSMAHIDAIKSKEDDSRNCILYQGEGLLSRIMHLNTPAFDQHALEKYLVNIPLPDIIFFLDVPPEEILKRVKSRERVSSVHAGMDDKMIYEYSKKALSHFRYITKYAVSKGSRVYTLDGMDEKDKIPGRIINNLNSKETH